MDKVLAEMFGNMIDSITDEEDVQLCMKKSCPKCKSNDTSFDRNSGFYDCWNCMKRFC